MCGNVFSLCEVKLAQQRGKIVENETSQLRDGLLTDLHGATLLWHIAECEEFPTIL